MIKRIKSETKKTKIKLSQIVLKGRKNHSTKRKKTSKISKKNSKEDLKKRKINNISLSFAGPSITDLINSLDANDNGKNSQCNFYLKFPSVINNRDFSKLFEKGINYAKTKFTKKNRLILKEILLILKDIGNQNSDNEFGLKNSINDLHRTCKIDLVLSLLSDESKIKELKINNLSEIQASLIQSIDYSLFIDNPNIKNAIIYNKNTAGYYSFKNFKDILFSPTILGLYKEILYELYNIKIKKEELKKVIKKFIEKHNIFFVLMNKRRYGMILYDGTIIINEMYYSLNYDISNIFIVYFTLLYEIIHAISRLLRSNDNYLLNIDEFTNLIKSNVKEKESRIYFENKFLINIIKKHELTDLEAKYLLEVCNYQYDNIKDFHSALEDFRNKRKKDINKSPTFAIGKSSDDDIIYLKGGCYCCGERHIDD